MSLTFKFYTINKFYFLTTIVVIFKNRAYSHFICAILFSKYLFKVK